MAELDVSNVRILVVDDNESNRLLAQGTLEDEGFSVMVASHGEEGLEHFRAWAPDCILLDVRMPRLDGPSTCQAIRNDPRGRDVPIIFLTALRDVDTFDRALAAGGDDFLTKPVNPSELILRVKASLKIRHLRTELHEHYDLLKRQRDDLMRLQLQKERLVAFLVHDLKNPVNTMDLHAQLLLRSGDLSDNARQSVSTIRMQARQLNRMILNLLDISKADEGKLLPQPTRIDLDALVHEVIREFDVQARERTVRVDYLGTQGEARLDADLFRRLVANLLENAIRYSPAEGVVSVQCARHKGALQLSVRDLGRGVPKELHEKVFDPFTQLETPSDIAATTRNAGRGLGLTFCKLVANAHGGRIWVEDAVPGARFCVAIPQEEESR